MGIEKLSEKNLENISGGIKLERLQTFSIMTENENGTIEEVKNEGDIKPNRHYWLNPHTGRDGDWMALGYGRDGMAKRYVKALKGENSLSLEDVSCLSENYGDLV